MLRELTDPAHTVLEAAGRPMRGVQYDARSRWPDGSVQWMTWSYQIIAAGACTVPNPSSSTSSTPIAAIFVIVNPVWTALPGRTPT